MEAGALTRGTSRLTQDRRAELSLGALVSGVLVLLVAMLAFIVGQAWPSFAHNGLPWFGAGGNVDNQIATLYQAGQAGQRAFTLHTWDLLYATALIVGTAVLVAFVLSLFTAIFLVEFAPPAIRRVLEPVVRVLASVPSVVFGLLGVYVLVPFVGQHLITQAERASVTPVITLTGSSWFVGSVVLTLMICPIMISIFAEGLAAVPRSWLEGSLALGVNQWRSFWRVAVRSARPALIAGTVLATARGLGESIMLFMLTGGRIFAPNPGDGGIFLFEPAQTYASTLIGNTDGVMSNPPLKHAVFAIGAVLLFSTALLSAAGWAVKQPMRQYFNVGGVA